MPPEGDLATKLYTSARKHVEIEIVYTSDQQNVEIDIVYTSDQTNVEIEQIYTSDQKASKPLTTILLFFGQYLYILPLAHDNIFIFCLLPTTIFKNIARVKTDLLYTNLQY